ncbi:unnamed protein product [Meganyctiphanes norvegica]|uniref:C2H2-type domain-containing protein n=1 Tax=Meganyctiphanes norvegica TaxID=48144 RepID=A0AAV2SQF1_MEGNR
MNSVATESFASNQNNSIRMCFRKKQYQCSSCDKSFSTKNVLTEHEETHKGGNFSCYQCGDVASTLTKMVAHMKIHSFEEETLSLGDTDSCLNTSYELIEMEPLGIAFDDVLMDDESLTNQSPKEDYSNESKSNECKMKNYKDITPEIINIEVERETKEKQNKIVTTQENSKGLMIDKYKMKNKEKTEYQNKSVSSEENISLCLFKAVDNELSISKTSEYMKGKENTLNSISNINRSKGVNGNEIKRVVKGLNTLNKISSNGNKYNDNEQSSSIAPTIYNTKNISKYKKTETQGSIILNDSEGQYSINEINGSIDKTEIKCTEVELANKDINKSNINIDIYQISPKQENQDIFEIGKSPQNDDEENEEFKKEDFNSVKKDIVKFKCNQCNYEGNHRSNLWVHKKRHWPKELLKCQHCNYKNKSKGFMDRHIERHKILNESEKMEVNNKVLPEINIIKSKKNIEKKKKKKIKFKFNKGNNITKKIDGILDKSLDSGKTQNEINNSDRGFMERHEEKHVMLNESKVMECNNVQKTVNINKDNANEEKNKRKKIPLNLNNHIIINEKIENLVNKKINILVSMSLNSGKKLNESNNSDKGFIGRHTKRNMRLNENKIKESSNNVQQLIDINKNKTKVGKNKRKKIFPKYKNNINMDEKIGRVNISLDSMKFHKEINNS